MEDLKQYLAATDKDYFEGVDLLKKYEPQANEIVFLLKNDGSKGSFGILLKKLQAIYRISLQKAASTNEQPRAAIQIGNKPIIVPKQHFSEVEAKLEQTKLLTNKLLAREWFELNEREQGYFKSDSNIFAYKKELLIENSKIEGELKSLHAQLQLAIKDEKRKPLAEKMVTLKKKQAENWETIDNFNFSIENAEKIEITDKAESILKRNNLRSRVSKLEKQVLNTSDKKYQKKLSDLENCKKELEEINKLL
jgi:hypothetical protein